MSIVSEYRMLAKKLVRAGAVASVLFGPLTWAEQLPVVTVTANKIEQPKEKVPGSLSVFYGDELLSTGIDSLEDLSRRTPNFSFQPFGQSGTNVPVVRGLSSGATAFSSSMLMLVDGVPTLTGQGFDASLIGVERVEVLRGPQSTLYGRNAEAGVLGIYTRQPGDELHTRFEAGTGSRNKRAINFDLGGALLAKKLYAGISGEWLAQDGFIDNTFQKNTEDDRERFSGRAVLRWEPTSFMNISMRYSGQKYDDGGSVWGPITATEPEVSSGTDSWNRSKGNTLALDVRAELSSDMTLRSITAHNQFNDKVRQDTDFQPGDLFYLERDFHFDTLSQELRLENKADTHQWLLGLYADMTDHELDFTQFTPIGQRRTVTGLEGSTQALFGQWVQPLDDHWSFTLGGRYELNNVSLLPSSGTEQNREWQRFTPKLALQYQLNEETLFYSSYTQGFRAGGFNAFSAMAGYPAYDPEKVSAYELGLKGSALDRRLLYEAAAYWMDVSDMQVQQIVQPGVVFITNAAQASSAGIELSTDYLMGQGWWLQASLGLNRTRFDEFRDAGGDYKGNNNPFAPEATGYLGVRYEDQLGWFAQAGFSGKSSIYLDAQNKNRQPGHALLDLRLGYEHGPYTFTFFADNVMNKRYDAVGFLNGTARVYSSPRELGITARYKL